MNTFRLFVATALVAAPMMAQAIETMSETQTLGPHATDWTTNSLIVPNADMLYAPLEFQKFDRSLGRLTGVRIDVVGSFTATMRIFNSGTHTLQSAEVSVDMIVDVGNDGTAETTMTMSDQLGSPPLPLALTTPGSIPVDATVSGSVSKQLNIDVSNATELAKFIDLDGGPLGTFQVGCGSTSAHIANIVPTDGLALFTHQADSSCQVTISYQYVAYAPVPGSLLLMLPGMFWIRRRVHHRR